MEISLLQMLNKSIKVNRIFELLYGQRSYLHLKTLHCVVYQTTCSQNFTNVYFKHSQNPRTSKTLRAQGQNSAWAKLMTEAISNVKEIAKYSREKTT